MVVMNAHLPVINPICEKVKKNSMASKNDSDENDSEIKIEWDCNVEMLLFYAMLGLKPVGVNRHFMMMCIHQRFSEVLNKEIPSKLIWDYLDSLYDMAALHESEIIPFPNEEVDYELPTSYYDLASDQLGVTLQNPDEESNDSKSEYNSKSSKKTNASKSKQNGTPVSTSKNVFLTPVSGKFSKQSLNKSETKTPSTSSESNVKVKQDSPFPTKSNKVKRSSSPFPAKNSKAEQSASTKDETEPPPAKKIKTEISTPISSKKISKTDSNNSSKKSSKQEPNSASKQKPETPDSVSKKVKNEKDLNKKNKTSTSSENSVSKKNSKPEVKKPEEVSKKQNESTSNKLKSDNRSSSVSSKGSKHEDSDSSQPSGSRKSLSVAKNDSDKKKKKTSPVKRRRT